MGRELNIKTVFIQLLVLFFALGGIYLLLRLPELTKRKEKEIVELKEVTITIPEGMNVRQIAETLAKNGLFHPKEFLAISQKEEGYLFPDTYRFYKDASPEDVVIKMKENFNKKVTAEIISSAEKQGRTLNEVVIMASILEEEVQSTEDRKIVAGILWKRLDIGMGLNVDSSLTYVLGKTSAELTESDLKINSPYNTYRRRGLPPTPISNPGLDAITAAISPTKTKYLYYLTGTDGKTYFAETLEGHALNKRKYLR